MSIFEKETENSYLYCQDTIEDGKGVRVLRKFFSNLLENFDDEVFSFYKIWGEFPFIYGEKQLASVLAPAIHKYTDNVWFEQPFKDYQKNQRFLDIAIADKENIYLIELKHSWNSKTETTDQKTSKRWETAINQIKDINRKTIYDHFNFQEYNVFKIALMILPTYIALEDKHAILAQTAEEYANNLFDEYNNNWTQKYQTNFTGVMKLQNPTEYKHEYTNAVQIYPFVSFIARIERV